MLLNGNFSNSNLPVDLYPSIFQYIDLNSKTSHNIRLVCKNLKNEMEKYLNKNFTKIEILYTQDATLTPISFYVNQSKHETIMVNPGHDFFANMEKEEPPQTRIRVTNKKLDLCLTSNVGEEDDEIRIWCFIASSDDDMEESWYAFEMEKTSNGGEVQIHVSENMPETDMPYVFKIEYVPLQTMLDFFAILL